MYGLAGIILTGEKKKENNNDNKDKHNTSTCLNPQISTCGRSAILLQFLNAGLPPSPSVMALSLKRLKKMKLLLQVLVKLE